MPYCKCIHSRLCEEEPSVSKHVENIKIKNLNVYLENVYFVGLYCIIGVVTSCVLEGPGCQSRQGKYVFLKILSDRLCGTTSLLFKAKRGSFLVPVRPFDHSPPWNAEDTKEWSCTSPPLILHHDVNRDNVFFLHSLFRASLQLLQNNYQQDDNLDARGCLYSKKVNSWWWAPWSSKHVEWRKTNPEIKDSPKVSSCW